MTDTHWTPGLIQQYADRYGIFDDKPYHYHFPQQSFLADGYHPPGGYVKDFTIIQHAGRWHLLHIDGRPGEICWITGNEISFGHASTGDFQHWLRHPMPLAVTDSPCESEHIWAPYVLPWQDHFVMFYMGSGPGGTFITSARSQNLTRWQRREEGPVREAIGRDPFLRMAEDGMVMYYTASGGNRPGGAIGACRSADLAQWQALPDVMATPRGSAPESCSVFPHQDQFLLWFNLYRRFEDGRCLMQARYAYSDDPLRFDFDASQTFAFDAPAARDVPLEYGDCPPCPVALELVARRDPVWLVCYFRQHIDRFRLFFGALDWSADPAIIREINTHAQLSATLSQVGITITQP